MAKSESTLKNHSKETTKSNESVTLEEREAVLSASGCKVEITSEQLEQLYLIWYSFDGILTVLDKNDYHSVYHAFRPLQEEFNQLFEDLPLRGAPEDPSDRAKRIREHREEVISNRPEVTHE
ncbi:MAG: hypothetical protein JXR49_17595 [Acidobacteria bacterium]|nr:hypothetical protein [Acidobacteriota bacterium]